MKHLYPIRMKYVFVLSFLLMSLIPSAFVKADDTFTATTEEGVEMTFMVLSEAEKTCQVGTCPLMETNWWSTPAISRETKGVVTIPSTANGYKVTAIGDWGFVYCMGLTSVNIPESVEKIGQFAFYSCQTFSSVKIPASVSHIGNFAFEITKLNSVSVDENNTVYDSRNNCNAIIETATNTLMTGCKNTIIPEDIEVIAPAAFYDCSGLTEVNLPETLTTIGNNAFSGCEDLTAIHIPKGVTSLDSGILHDTPSLQIITVDSENPYYDSRDNCNALIHTNSNTLMCGCQNTVIPAGVTAIAAGAFHQCYTLTEINIPDGVETIGEGVFFWCRNLTSVQIAASVKSIGSGAFKDCNLTTVTSYIQKPFAINEDVFTGLDTEKAILYVPYGTKGKYEAAEGWNKFQNIVEMEAELNSMPYIVWCKDNSTLYFLSSNTELKKGDTYDGQTITDVWSGEDVTNTVQNEIAGQFSPPKFAWTTRECTRVVFDKSFENVRVRSTSCWFGSNVESIEGLEYLNTSEVTSMSYMFSALKLSSIDLSHLDTRNVKYMHSMFEQCSNLTSLDLSHFDTKNVQSMAEMFRCCTALTTINLSGIETGNLVNMNNMFRECSSLTTLDLSHFDTSNVTTMQQMCYGCSNLESIDMSSFNTDKVTNMNWMFNQCPALKTIYAGSGWSTVNVTDGSWMFGNCTSLVGGRGTVYDENNPHYTYAHIDGGSSNPGYFTDKNASEEDLEAAKQDLLNMIYACMEEREYVQKNLSDKASESEAPELYQQMSEIDERLAYAWYLLDKATSMEELKDVQAMTYEIRERLYYLEEQVESFETPSTFIAKTVEGIDMTFKVISEDEKTCQVWRPESNYFNAPVAIDKATTGQVTIPEVANGYRVVSIGEEAFYYCPNITSVVIPASVTDIGDRAFCGCESLYEIPLSSGLKIIGDAVFYGTNLSSVVIPASVISIGSVPYGECPNLKTIVVESGNTVYDSRDNCNAIISTRSNSLIQGCAQSFIPSGVTYIGWMAFKGAVGLEDLFIPKTVQSISYTAFELCSGLKSIHVEDGNPVYDSRNNSNAIIETSSKTLVLGCRNTFIPDGIESIGEDAFMGCNQLSSINIPKSVKSIGGHAFEYCKSLTSIEIPEGVTEISYLAFYGCSNLKSVSIPEGVTSIGFCAFDGCSSLEEVVLPNSVISLDNQAFMSNSSLKKVTLGSGITRMNYASFLYCYNLETIISNIQVPFALKSGVFDYNEGATLYVPAGTKALYEATEGWNKFQNIVEMDVEPIDQGEVIDFADLSGVEVLPNLDGNIVGNLFFNILNDNGGYDSDDGCIVITESTPDESLAQIADKDFFDKELHETFTGIIFKVPAGTGNIKVTAQTMGNVLLKVKIGDAEPSEFELGVKKKVKIPYNVTEETLVYIYAGGDVNVKGVQSATSSSGALKIYSIESESIPTGITIISDSSDAVIYNLGGQRLTKPQKGINIVGGKKVVVK